MADQTFNVKAGFFNSVNQDREYYAEDMNRPYKRLVSNGVFATPEGTPSTDLQVIPGSGMVITVSAGQGIFADKWFENETGLVITVPDNPSVNPRIDSVLVQVDERQSGRVGNIVYRTGNPSANPAEPDINTVNGVTEYRVASIYVGPSVTSIGAENITDKRGSSDCPWITSLIYQVDTSVLFDQWEASYNKYFEDQDQEFTAYIAQQRQAWQDFLETLTEDLSVTTNVIVFTSEYVSSAAVTSVPINIASYDPHTDVLQVYINGLKAGEGSRYSVNAEGTAIDLTAELSAGQTVNFVVFKSVIEADVASTVSLIRSIDQKVSAFTADSGWMPLSLIGGAEEYSESERPAVRCIGDRVYMRGTIKGSLSVGTILSAIPAEYRPSIPHKWLSCAYSGANISSYILLEVNAQGYLMIKARSGKYSSDDGISIATTFLASAGITSGDVFEFKGSVNTYADLPSSGVNAGDVYEVETADAAHGIDAGDMVMWNGSEWELYSTTISSSEIDSIINSIS